MGLIQGVVIVNQRLIMEKALKDITNKLESRPVKMKPNWGGLKNGSGLVISEVGRANK